jgi:hypothetical protein
MTILVHTTLCGIHSKLELPGWVDKLLTAKSAAAFTRTSKLGVVYYCDKVYVGTCMQGNMHGHWSKYGTL